MSQPEFIYLCGPDGVGKTTQTQRLLERLGRHEYEHVWLRFFHCFSLPLLAVARVAGVTSQRTIDGDETISQHHFERSTILSKLYPFVLMIDTAIYVLYTLAKYRIVRRQKIVFDRFVYDTVSQAMVSTGRNDLPKRTYTKLFLSLLPDDTQTLLLMSDERTLRGRRDDVRADPTIGRKIETYEVLAQQYGLHVLDASAPEDDVHAAIMEVIEDGDQ